MRMAKNTSDHRVTFLADPELYAEILKRADAADQAVATWIRRSLRTSVGLSPKHAAVAPSVLTVAPAAPPFASATPPDASGSLLAPRRMSTVERANAGAAAMKAAEDAARSRE